MTPAQMTAALATANAALAEKLGASPHMSAGLMLTDHGWSVVAHGTDMNHFIRSTSCADPEAAFASFGQVVDAMPCPKARVLAQYVAAIAAATAMGIDASALRAVEA